MPYYSSALESLGAVSGTVSRVSLKGRLGVGLGQVTFWLRNPFQVDNLIILYIEILTECTLLFLTVLRKPHKSLNYVDKFEAGYYVHRKSRRQ